MNLTIDANKRNYVNMSSNIGRGQIIRNPSNIGGWHVCWTINGKEGDSVNCKTKREARKMLENKLS